MTASSRAGAGALALALGLASGTLAMAETTTTETRASETGIPETRTEEVVSPGGIRAWLVHEPAVPIVAVSFDFRGGASLDPEGLPGTAYMVSGLLDEGAGDLDSQAFQTELEDHAIRLGFDAGRDGFSGNLRTLTEHADHAFDLLRLALTEPRFDEEPVERIRSQIQVGLARQAEDPNRIAGETWFAEAFPDHPYAQPTRGTPESIARIEVEDLRRFVDERLAKDNLVIGVAGDITAEQLGPLLDHAFGALPETSAAFETETRAPARDGTRIVRREIPQSVVLFGHQGLPRAHPDYYAATVANHILGGGGFGSRLTEEVRERRGLAYSVYSYLSPLDQAPLFMGGVASGNAQVGQALDIIRDQIARMAAGDIDEARLADAKTYLTGSFPLRLTTNASIAGTLVGMQIHDLGIDFIERRNDFIEAVTLDDLRRVAADLFDPEALFVVVVGDPAGLEG